MNALGGPLPLGEGGAKRRLRVAGLVKSRQILQPSPYPPPEGEDL